LRNVRHVAGMEVDSKDRSDVARAVIAGRSTLENAVAGWRVGSAVQILVEGAIFFDDPPIVSKDLTRLRILDRDGRAVGRREGHGCCSSVALHALGVLGLEGEC